MKKILMILILFACVMSTAQAGIIYGEEYYKQNRMNLMSAGQDDPLFRHLVETNALLFPATGDAAVWYVNANVTSAGAGTSWATAFATTDEGISACSAGDFVDVAEAHAESGTDPNLWVADVAGITIRHYGNGNRQGSYTFADTDTTIHISAADVTIYGGRLLAGISGVVVGLDVTATAGRLTVVGMDFPEPTSAAFEFVRAIMLATAADNVRIIGCNYSNVGAIGATNFIDLDTGIVDELQIIDNTIKGEFAEGAIHSDKVCTSMWIEGNVITNFTTGQHGIEITANATGVLKDNVVSTDTIAASYDVGFLEELGTNWWDDEGTRDTSPVPWTTNETGVNRWGASELAQIEGEATDALEADHLDHFYAVSVADEIVDDSYAADIAASDGDWSGFDKTTDSLEAIADALAAVSALVDSNGTTGTTIAGQTYVTTVTTVDANDNDLFDVSGGAIIVNQLVGLITTNIVAAAGDMKILLDADAGWVDHDLSTAVEMNGDLAGQRIMFSNANPAVLTPVTVAAGGSSTLMSPWYVGEGMLEMDNADEDATGVIQWIMVWTPVDNGTTVTPQPQSL